MKVIIIKDCKNGRVNDVIDVSTGYATNFLIKQKFALPLNAKTKLMLNKKIHNLEEIEKSKIENSIKIKEIIETLNLKFKLKVTNTVVHGSITKKQILKELANNGIKIDTRHIENVRINSLGNTKVKINLFKNMKANVNIEVTSE